MYPEDLKTGSKPAASRKNGTKLERLNGAKTLEVLMDRGWIKRWKSKGTMQVLHKGFSIAGCGLIEMTEAAPEDKRNEAVIQKRYQANILRVVPELKYHPARDFAIDLVCLSTVCRWRPSN